MSNQRFVCEICRYETTRKSKLDRHCQSIHHENINRYVFDKYLNDVQLNRVVVADEILESESGGSSPGANIGEFFSSTIYDQDGTEEDDFNNNRTLCPERNPFFPFQGKLHFLLCVLKHSPTHAVSDEVLKYILFMLKEMGLSDVPTLNDLKDVSYGELKWQNLVLEGADENSIPFWGIKPSEILKLLLSHPDHAKSLIRYPQNASPVSSHPANADRWKEISFHWAKHQDKVFYKGEIYSFSQHSQVLTGRIESFADDLQLDTLTASLRLIQAEEGIPSTYYLSEKEENVPLSELSKVNKEEYKHLEENCTFSINNPLTPVWTLPLNIFLDDTSTHRSKKWLPLHCIQMQAAGMPLHMRQDQETITVLGASEKVKILDLMQPIIEDIKECKREGVVGFDALTKEECIITTDINALIGDFNMVSHCCNHLGASATFYCPRCYATKNNFRDVLGRRQPEKTQRTIERINIRSHEKDKKVLRTQTGVKEHSNPLWGLVDPHRDMPVGLLHLIPLGLTKHLLGFLLSNLTANVIETLQTHLSSLSTDAFSKKFFETIESRQGKDFKKYLQLAPVNFAYIGIQPRFQKMICTLAMIQKQVYAKEVEDVNALTDLINQYQYQIDMYAPELKRKVKTHLLGHLPEDIRRQGPPTAFLEDGFEKKHGTIRTEIFQQNQKARSRDTAKAFAESYITNHVVTGGYFPIENGWSCCGTEVSQLMTDTHVQKFLGKEHSQKACRISNLMRTTHGKPELHSAEEMGALQACIDLGIGVTTNVRVIQGSTISTARQELCHQGDAVVYKDHDNKEQIGVFVEGLIFKDQGLHAAKIQQTQDEGTDQPTGCMRISFLESFQFVPAKQVLRAASVFHDCASSGCSIKEARTTTTVEQRDTVTVMKAMKHRQSNSYLLNKYAF